MTSKTDKPEPRERPEPEAVLAVGSFACFAIVTLFILLKKIPDENEKYAMLMLGALIGLVKDTFGRYFGSTKGAQEQRREVAKTAEKLAETLATSTAATAAALAPAAPPATVPVEVKVTEVSPYADLTDDELRGELIRRREDSVVVNQMDRPALMARLAELDSQSNEVMP